MTLERGGLLSQCLCLLEGAWSHRGRPPLAADHTAGTLDKLAGLVAEHGYEPRPREGRLELANCPFRELAREHAALVCGLTCTC